MLGSGYKAALESMGRMIDEDPEGLLDESRLAAILPQGRQEAAGLLFMLHALR
jgi:hypothetical protein